MPEEDTNKGGEKEREERKKGRRERKGGEKEREEKQKRRR